MNLLSGAEIWCPLSVLERLSPYYRGFFKEKICENFIGITLETVRIREVSVPRGSTVIVLFSKVLVIIHAPATFSVIVVILIRF